MSDSLIESFLFTSNEGKGFDYIPGSHPSLFSRLNNKAHSAYCFFSIFLVLFFIDSCYFDSARFEALFLHLLRMAECDVNPSQRGYSGAYLPSPCWFLPFVYHSAVRETRLSPCSGNLSRHCVFFFPLFTVEKNPNVSEQDRFMMLFSLFTNLCVCLVAQLSRDSVIPLSSGLAGVWICVNPRCWQLGRPAVGRVWAKARQYTELNSQS